MDYQHSCGDYTSTRGFFTSRAAPVSLSPMICPYIFTSKLHLCVLPYLLCFCGCDSHAQSLKFLQSCSFWAWNRKQETGTVGSSTYIFWPARKMQHLWLRILPPTHNTFSEHFRRYNGFAAQRRWIQAPCQRCFQSWRCRVRSVSPFIRSSLHTWRVSPNLKTACLELLKLKGTGEKGRIPIQINRDILP